MTHGDGDGRAEYFCPETDCDFTSTRPGPLATHIKFKHTRTEVVPNQAPVPVAADVLTNELGQAYLPWLKSTERLGVGQRMIKMLQPRCDICKGNRGWWETCPHDPYVTIVPITEHVPRYEDVEGQPGVKRIVEMEELVRWEPRPNLHEVALTPRVNAGRGYYRARYKGEILPIELRSPAFPNGVAPICQFRGCFVQKGLHEYSTGVFCRKIEAQLVWFDQEGKVLEYDHPLDRESQGKRRQLLSTAEIN